MTVYFGMLDGLLAAEELPEEYRNRCQDILCNDCGKRAFSVPLVVSQMRRLWLVQHQSYQDRGTRLFHVELTGVE
ncbi:uncharacterized protein LOC125543260 isoform X2 [Triticum urartu]|uniref:uncharacterized protein LOC125543260 isoform X2 n=1 Tax=Triticum urartu TaxID=4572 RepID=UPI00204433CE|nr:uncharacterized protein LOC125543260 isoform X2 [Triticum urartu]